MNDELLEIATKTMENFNPATDSADDFEKLPDGEYVCLLEDVQAKKNEKGSNWISFKYSILSGDYEKRYIFVNYFFTEKTQTRSVKMITKLAYELGYELPIEAFTTFEKLAETLNNLAGNQVIIKQTTSKNDFTNYKVTPLQ